MRYDQGLAAHALGLTDSARAAWSDAVGLDGARARAAAAYNLGNDALRAGKLEQAIDWYRASLRSDWKKADAKRNLEEAIRRLRQATPAPTPPASGGKGSTGPSGAGQGGGNDPRANPDSRSGNPPPSADTKSEAPSVKGPTPSKEEAELWLKALESERRSQRECRRDSLRQNRLGG